jgi:hypothetical protein
MGGAGCYQEGSLRFCEKSAQFHILVLIVQGNNDRSQSGDSKVAADKMRSVREKDSDPMATANSKLVKLSGERKNALLKLRIRQRPVACDNRGSAWILFRRSGEHFR